MTKPKKPAFIWAYEEGTLTVQHLGKTVSLGRYADREHAARAAERYRVAHGGTDATPAPAAPAAGESGQRPLAGG